MDAHQTHDLIHSLFSTERINVIIWILEDLTPYIFELDENTSLLALLSPWQPVVRPKHTLWASRQSAEFTEALSTKQQEEMGRGRQPFRGEQGEWAGRSQRDQTVLLQSLCPKYQLGRRLMEIYQTFFTVCPV